MFGRTKPARAFMRSCKVYFSEQHQAALVATMVNHAGLLAERPNGVLKAPFGDAGELGRLARAALEECEWQPEFNQPNRKRTEWPAFQQSGCRSIREFESAYDGILVCGANEVNLIWEVRSASLGRFDIGTVGTISAAAPDGELGECLLAVWESYRQLRERRSAEPAA